MFLIVITEYRKFHLSLQERKNMPFSEEGTDFEGVPGAEKQVITLPGIIFLIPSVVQRKKKKVRLSIF
jgi:hypothetical protein